MKNFGRIVFAFGFTVFLILVARLQPSCAEEIDRTALPIPDVQYQYPGKVPLDARDAKFPPIKPLRAAASTCPRWIHLG
jgi:hypothetical protein